MFASRLAMLALSLIAFASGAQAQVVLPDWDTVEIKTHQVCPNIYMLEGFGGNIGVYVSEDGLILVDDQYAPLTEKILAALEKLSDQPVKYVLNTHWHPDHTGGNENFGKSGAVIISHDKTRQYLLDFHKVQLAKNETAHARGDIPVLTSPVLTFNDTTTIHAGGQTIKAFHVNPAHTDGDIVIQFVEADVLHTGDTYFNGFYPFIDVQHGGSIDGMIALYDQLIGTAGPDTKIIPGHGDVANRDDMRSYQTMLITVRTRVAAALEAGTSLEDLISAEPLKDLDPVFGGNLIKAHMLLGMVYGDLQKHRQN